MGGKIRRILAFLRPKNEFNQLALPFWKTPDFLLFVLALINIGGMLSTYFWASRKIDPREAVLWVALESGFVLIIGNMIVELFKKSLSALKMKKDFISIISHQLRNPLTTIKWSLERIENENELFPGKLKEHLNKITFANENLIELSNNFIFLEKIEDVGNIQAEKVEVVGLMREKISEFMLLAESKKIQIKFLSNQKKLFVFANENFLKTIFDNFLSNALRYSFEKRPISVRIKKEKEGPFFMFEDVGVKIEKKETASLFEKFYRSDSAKKFSPQGSGLGLYISKILTEKMGGKIGVFSRGKKTIFWVSFPEQIQDKK